LAAKNTVREIQRTYKTEYTSNFLNWFLPLQSIKVKADVKTGTTKSPEANLPSKEDENRIKIFKTKSKLQPTTNVNQFIPDAVDYGKVQSIYKLLNSQRPAGINVYPKVNQMPLDTTKKQPGATIPTPATLDLAQEILDRAQSRTSSRPS
jgi:hypothetical protein